MEQLPKELIYPLYTALIMIISFVLIPRKVYKDLFIYGIIFGGIGELIVMSIAKLLKLGEHIGYGPFGFLSFAFFPPLAWTIWFVMFMYYLPERRALVATYIISAAIYAVFFSNVLMNLQVFVWYKDRMLIPFIIYAVWFAIAVIGYMRLKVKPSTS